MANHSVEGQGSQRAVVPVMMMMMMMMMVMLKWNECNLIYTKCMAIHEAMKFLWTSKNAKQLLAA
jgi:hypothetical protein